VLWWGLFCFDSYQNNKPDLLEKALQLKRVCSLPESVISDQAEQHGPQAHRPEVLKKGKFWQWWQ
jgi:hypothetical protein